MVARVKPWPNRDHEEQADHKSATRRASLLQHARQHLENGQIERAIDLLRTSPGSDMELRNALGVCLLRTGRSPEAVRVFRSLCLARGCTWIRSEVPAAVRANFAMALFLSGRTIGAREVLSDTANQNDPSIVRARQQLDRWVKSLPWWQRLLWHLGLDSDRPTSIDGPAGEFIEVAVPGPNDRGSEPPLPHAA